MPAQILKAFLDSNKIKYVSIVHSPSFTAPEIAASAHISGKELAKTVVVYIDGKMCLAVLPANRKIAIDKLRSVAGANEVRLASESEFKSRFPDCETGAMPPFGQLYDMDAYVDETLVEDEQIAFNAGTHTELIKMSYKDFERLAEPKIAKFTP